VQAWVQGLGPLPDARLSKPAETGTENNASSERTSWTLIRHLKKPPLRYNDATRTLHFSGSPRQIDTWNNTSDSGFGDSLDWSF
jgi:hypothetical protein